MPGISALQLAGQSLTARGHPILSDVPENISLAPHQGPESIHGAFLGAVSPLKASHHKFSLGKLRDLRFLSCFRFKLWWMTQKVGTRGSDVPVETQFILLESAASSRPAFGGNTDVTYVVLLPLLEHSFRSSFEGGPNDELLLCVESGDPSVLASEFCYSVFAHSGTDPYVVTSEAVMAVEEYSKSFRSREKKKMPGLLDYFGWCTWDAFYTDVTVDGVHEGLKSLASGGTPAKFLIIDDGWQSVAKDGVAEAEINITQGTQYASRLMDIKANSKFKKALPSFEPPIPIEMEVELELAFDLGHVVHDMKEKHQLKYVYVWHALMGYWGGVSMSPPISAAPGAAPFNPSLVHPVPSVGVLTQQPNMAEDSLTINGLGVVPPEQAHAFYDHLHGYLAGMGVDGVKVDVQAILETLGAGRGGRVAMARTYHSALEASVARHFPDNGVISCMSHHTDGIYNSMQTAVVRASDDFWPEDPASHSTHVASVAYNSLFLGEFMQPDWDMFHSDHPAAEYHGAARAIGGCAVYVSDKPGKHNFELLSKLVLPDGAVLRAQMPGRPTRDSLFIDPARDNISMLKIWNLNPYGGIVGTFNCQGAGWCVVEKKYSVHDPSPPSVSGCVRAMDVDALRTRAPAGWSVADGEAAIYAHRAGDLVRLPAAAPLAVTLGPLEYELFTVVPILTTAVADVAPIGLIDMFNSSGAVVAFTHVEEPGMLKVHCGVKGRGRFLVYTSKAPLYCHIDGAVVSPLYDAERCRLEIELTHMSGHVWLVDMAF